MLGAGTQSNPYIIQTPADLNAIRNNLTAYYELANDIDMTGVNWTPIDNFNGQIDGKGHKILNLKIPTGFSYAGFIGNTTKTFTVKNLGFENVNIASNYYNAGALVSYTTGTNVLIENCYVKGGTITAQGYAGGLIGNLRGTATVRNCFAILDKIYTTQYRSAGFIAVLYGNTHTVENCYAVTYDLSSANVSERYGFSYYNGNSVVNNCYWDKEVSGVTQSSYGTGKTTAEMKQQSTYVGWDFTNVWGINGDYPYLRIFGTPPRQPQQVSVTIQSHINPIQSKTSKNNKSTKQTQSFLNTIQTQIQRHTRTKKTISTYSLPIVTSVQKSNRTVRSAIATVNTYINPIGSLVERKTKTINRLLSYVDSIQSNVNVIAPIRNKVVNAYISIIENPSIVQFEGNLSNTYTFENHSTVQFEDNLSNTYAIENPSSVEVI